MSYVATSLGPRLRGDDDFNTFNCRVNSNFQSRRSPFDEGFQPEMSGKPPQYLGLQIFMRPYLQLHAIRGWLASTAQKLAA